MIKWVTRICNKAGSPECPGCLHMDAHSVSEHKDSCGHWGECDITADGTINDWGGYVTPADRPMKVRCVKLPHIYIKKTKEK